MFGIPVDKKIETNSDLESENVILDRARNYFINGCSKSISFSSKIKPLYTLIKNDHHNR